MILVHNRTYPLVTRFPSRISTVYYSIHTGEPFARIDRGAGTWGWLRCAAEGEPDFPPGVPPGSLYISADPLILFELPRPLLEREVEVAHKFALLNISRYNLPNSPSPDTPSMTPDDLLSRTTELRNRVLAGTITDDELREALKIMRQGRISSSSSASTNRIAKSKATPQDAQAELDALFRS